MCNTLSIGLINSDYGINYVDINYRDQADLNTFCEALADYIVKKYEKTLINRTINRNFFYLNSYEKREVYQIVKRMIAESEKDPNHACRQRKTIKENLFDYIEDSSHMILDGFVTFRLSNYMYEIEDMVDKAVDEYIVQKEYQEFIKLLKYFVEMQDSSYNAIHVMANVDKTYSILDDNYSEITQECTKDFLVGLQAGEINYDDVLISTLISLAPKKVILHKADMIINKQLLETIKNIFVTRLRICEGCHICHPETCAAEIKI